MKVIDVEPVTEQSPGAILQTSAISALPAGEIRQIPLDQLHESAWNPRQYYPDAAMNELIESMKQSGFRAWLPLMVRPIVDEDGCEAFEIGAGHRRSRAAREAGIAAVPCVVRALTDEQFLDVLNFDNCGREDVHPLHEAAGWRAWMEKTGKGVIDIAARIGQSKEYVYQRMKYSALIPAASEAFLDGKITDGHAILIARLQPNDQKKALKFCEPPQYDPTHRPSVRDLAAFIQRGVHLNDYQVGKLGKNGAKLAVVVDGMNAGELIAVRLNSAPHASAEANSTHKAQLEKEAEKVKAKVDHERSIRLAILDAIRKKIVAGKNLAKWEIGDLIKMALDGSDVSASGLAELCRIRGISVDPAGDWDDSAAIALESALPSLSHEEMMRLAVELPMGREFDYHVIARNEPPKRLIDVARSYGVDAAKIRREIEAQGKTGGQKSSGKKVKKAPAKKIPPTKPAAAKKGRPVTKKKSKSSKGK